MKLEICKNGDIKLTVRVEIIDAMSYPCESESSYLLSIDDAETLVPCESESSYLLSIDDAETLVRRLPDMIAMIKVKNTEHREQRIKALESELRTLKNQKGPS